MRSLTVYFYHASRRPEGIVWRWNDAILAPVEGQRIAPPGGPRWEVVAVTWFDADHAEVLVRDAPVGQPRAIAPADETVVMAAGGAARGRRRAEPA